MILLMRALVSRPDAPFAEMAEVPDPAPTPDEAIVAVHAFSLNRGECNRLATMAPGTVAGWDLAGEVVQAAADGTGPGVGARVVGLVNLGRGPSASPLQPSTSPSCPRGSPSRRRRRCPSRA